MPTRASRPCRKAGCPALVDNGFCESHRKTENANRERWRGTASSRGYDSEWRRLRLQALIRDKHICQHCLAAGRATSADEVHHILKIATHPHLRLVLTNLISLCKRCHAKLTANGE
jgi:5-methylcytosine-specific restriction protein A